MDIIFNSIFDWFGTPEMNVWIFLIILASALITGIVFALMSNFRGGFSKSFFLTLSMLPAAVAIVIVMVNGSVGIGVAVAGAFSLVRFRSLPGSAKEICAIFMSMAAGLALGIGYIAYAVIFIIVMGAGFIVFNITGFGGKIGSGEVKLLKITIPEDLNYTEVFSDILAEYTVRNSLMSAKMVNMGSMIKLIYSVVLKDPAKEKEFMDALRCRNGNLELSIYLPKFEGTDL